MRDLDLFVPVVLLVGCIIAAGLVGFRIGYKNGGYDVIELWQRATVEKGYAEYCTKSGDWSWIGECDE